MPIRMIELFAGIGATRQAMTELNLDVEAVAISEIDPNAIKGYEAIHGKTLNLGDITKIQSLPAADLITYSYPCQSLSIAGKKEGMREGSGTPSSLVWEVGRLVKDLVERGEPPAVLLMENVDAVLNRKNIGEFSRWVATLSELGYTSSWEVLNAKDYGTPQNRKRCFMVSARNGKRFIFPPTCPDGRVLRDVLESEVNDSFYLSEDRVKTFIRHKKRNDEKGNNFGFKIRDLDKPATAITTNADRYYCNWIASPKINVVGNIQIEGRHESALRIYGGSGLAPCIPACAGGGHMPKIEDAYYSNLRIRYLTPRECLRLQAFPDPAINALFGAIKSKTQLYRVAGNSIPVCVLRAIFEGIYIKKSFSDENDRQITLKRWGVA